MKETNDAATSRGKKTFYCRHCGQSYIHDAARENTFIRCDLCGIQDLPVIDIVDDHPDQMAM